MDSSSYSVHNTDYSHTGSDSPHPPPLEPVIDSQPGKTSPDYMTLSPASASFTVIRPCCLFLSLPLLLRSLLLACSSPPSHRSRSLFFTLLLPCSSFSTLAILLFLFLFHLPLSFVFRHPSVCSVCLSGSCVPATFSESVTLPQPKRDNFRGWTLLKPTSSST